MPFARDRIVESYLWAVGMYFEPQYLLGRKFFSLAASIAAVIDDIYDSSNASLEELELFTDAIQRLNSYPGLSMILILIRFLNKFFSQR